ncbi:FlgT C-terminal domain-containing protein [Metabacillus fastidiosus]|uniref:FlgT C-terminal domain-containing protein n=1 Tax=Metabacillus fastidiosus TaxID=1458 RepID=UPI003D272EA9
MSSLNQSNFNVFPAKVVAVLDYEGYRLVINRGTEHGVKIGQRFLVYNVGQELFDPDTRESLGKIEEVKGKGQVTHVQEKMATIESDQIRNERTIRKTGHSVLKPIGSEEEIIKPLRKPFENPERGDLVKPI